MSKKENIKSQFLRTNSPVYNGVYVFNMVDTEAEKLAYVTNTMVFKYRDDALKAMNDAIENDIHDEIFSRDELVFDDDDTAHTDRMYYTVRQTLIQG